MRIATLPRISVCALLVACIGEPAFGQADFVNKTRVSFGPGHGTQVSYMRSDGAVFLWYPGNRVVLRGDWRIQDGRVCFRYGANTYNPVTGRGGGGWECRPIGAFSRTTVDRVPGDVFGLTKRNTVPFVLAPDRTTIADLTRRGPP
jgi:hypothetical protein